MNPTLHTDAEIDAWNAKAAAFRKKAMLDARASGFSPTFDRWRHGGWYVTNIYYPSGACGCVSRNYEDKKWRIVCDSRPFDEAPTFKNRDEAARAEFELALAQHEQEAALASVEGGL